MSSRVRSVFGVALAAASVLVIGVSVAWACTGPSFGVPANPVAPTNDPPVPTEPESGIQPTAPAPSPQTGSEVTSPGTVDSRSTSGAVGTSPGTRQPVDSGSAAPAAAEQFEVRESGGTAGVVEQGSQPVFSSSTASKGKKADSQGAGSPSERSAAGDAWSGFASAASPAGSGAATSLGEDSSGLTTLGLAILGLGLAGVAGTLLVLAGPRRRRMGADRGPSSR